MFSLICYAFAVVSTLQQHFVYSSRHLKQPWQGRSLSVGADILDAVVACGMGMVASSLIIMIGINFDVMEKQLAGCNLGVVAKVWVPR